MSSFSTGEAHVIGAWGLVVESHLETRPPWSWLANSGASLSRRSAWCTSNRFSYLLHFGQFSSLSRPFFPLWVAGYWIWYVFFHSSPAPRWLWHPCTNFYTTCDYLMEGREYLYVCDTWNKSVILTIINSFNLDIKVD